MCDGCCECVDWCCVCCVFFVYYVVVGFWLGCDLFCGFVYCVGVVVVGWWVV